MGKKKIRGTIWLVTESRIHAINFLDCGRRIEVVTPGAGHFKATITSLVAQSGLPVATLAEIAGGGSLIYRTKNHGPGGECYGICGIKHVFFVN